MIKELEHTYIDIAGGSCHVLGVDEVVDKINEIIRYLNEKENNDGNSTTNP